MGCFTAWRGNSFSVGLAWNAAWYPKEQQSTALGIFGAGNVGASVTKLFGLLLIAALFALTVASPASVVGGTSILPPAGVSRPFAQPRAYRAARTTAAGAPVLIPCPN